MVLILRERKFFEPHGCYRFFGQIWTKKIAVVFLENLVHGLMAFLAQSMYEISVLCGYHILRKRNKLPGICNKTCKPKNGNHILVYWSLYSLWNLQNLHVMNVSFLLPFCPKRKFPEKQKEFRFLQRKQKLALFF